MPFNTALSGIRAASSDLSITGNNIANASTTGFKSSRAEFGDLYATSVLGAGSNPVGSGVGLQDVAQKFTQGNVTFTENEMDLSINGNGFFVLSRDGEQVYTRAGSFGLDSEGFIVNNVDARLQGNIADASGNIGGQPSDIRIQTSNLSPRPTTLVESLLNLDSSEPVLQSVGSTFQTAGADIANAQAGRQTATTTTLNGASFASGGSPSWPISFDVALSGATTGNGTISVSLNTPTVPATITNLNSLQTVASAINAQLLSPTAPATPIDVVAAAVDDGGGNFHLEFTTLASGEASQIDITNASIAPNAASDIGISNSTSTPGIPAVSNGYPAESLDITDPDGNVITYTSRADATAATTASELNSLIGISATATTSAILRDANFTTAGNLVITLNGVDLTSDTLVALETEINNLSSSTLPGITALLDATSGDLTITSAVGDDLTFSISSTTDGDSIEVIGDTATTSQILEVDTGGGLGITNATDASINSIVVGGVIDVTVDEDYSVANASTSSTNLFGLLTPTSFTNVVINQFDPTDQSTYNSATSMTIYDSLGNSHIMTQYFVRQAFDPTDQTTSPNHWLMYVQIDGQDVGDPDTTLPPPQNTVATQASYNVHFNSDGSLNTLLTNDILVSNWLPLDENGDYNGALRPINILAGGSTNIPDPPTSSNFVIQLDGTTQFGSEFSVNDVDQNGFTTGRLSGLNIDDSGIIFARFTNGESQTLGQILLADFANVQGLQPVGDTMWAENFRSGTPNVGTPGSAALGAIQSGALEESNVDLSEQLVNLIIAQRNFQASAKTIETADQTTQTIINLR